MAYFKFDSPLKPNAIVSLLFNGETYNGNITYGPVYYIAFGDHRTICKLLAKHFQKEFVLGEREKTLAKFNYDKDHRELFPEFSTVKDLEDFLNYFNDKYSEI